MKAQTLVIRYIIFAIVCLSTKLFYGQYSGRVFSDENGNGKKDKGEIGIAGAVVSNGFHLVKTNRQGEFDLPKWEKARFVTLYLAADQKSNDYFIPIGEKKSSYDFGVQLTPKKKAVSFVQISDTETFEYREWLNNLKSYATVEKPDFIVHTGDICYRSGMEWHAQEVTSEKLGVPIYYCLGNHDLIEGQYGEAFFEKKFGPAWYAFQKGNALYIITPMMGGDYKPGFTRDDIGGWLQNLLKMYPKELPKYFFNHDLLSNEEAFRFKIDDSRSIELNDYNLKAWVFGHLHMNYVKTDSKSGIKSYGTSTTAKGGIDHSPSSFRVIDVDEQGNSTSQLVWTYVKDKLQIVSPNNNFAFLDEDKTISLSVNAYCSNAKVDSVKYTVYDIAKNAWEIARTPSEMDKMMQRSDWNWTASFNPEKDKTDYKLVVYAYLKDGRTLHQQQIFSIAPSTEIESTTEYWNNLAGNPQHDAVTAYDHPPTYKLKWVKNIGGNVYMSSPVLSHGRVFTACFDDGNGTNNHIAAYDADTGKELWQYRTKNGIKNQMVIANDLIIATDSQGITYALECNTGKLRWEKDLDYHRAPGFVSGLVTDGKVVYTGFGSSLEALDAQTGTTLWINSEWSGGMGTTTTMTIADDALIASANWGALYAHNRKTGKLLWQRTDDGLRFRNGNILFKENSLWVAENLKGKIGALHQLDPKTGASIEIIKTPLQTRATTTPVLTDGKVYIAGSDPGIAAFQRSNGNKLWQFDVQHPILYTPQYYSDGEQSIETTPILLTDSLVFGAMDGWMYNLDADTGSVLWKTYLGAPILTTAAVTKDGFYICDFAGNLYYFVHH